MYTRRKCKMCLYSWGKVLYYKIFCRCKKNRKCVLVLRIYTSALIKGKSGLGDMQSGHHTECINVVCRGTWHMSSLGTNVVLCYHWTFFPFLYYLFFLPLAHTRTSWEREQTTIRKRAVQNHTHTFCWAQQDKVQCSKVNLTIFLLIIDLFPLLIYNQ